MPDAVLRRDDFAPHLGTAFALADGDDAIALTLAEIQPLASRALGDTGRQPFSLLFKADGPTILMQRTYRLAHPVMGALEIFLVPVARDDKGVSYEALFN